MAAERPWEPHLTISGDADRGLRHIGVARTEAAGLIARAPETVREQLRTEARVRAAHFSTKIDGNRLTLDEAAEILREGAAREAPLTDPVACLDPRARRVLALFAEAERITAREVARLLGLSERFARNLLHGWVTDGWLEVADPSRRARVYRLSAS